jgi:TPP-dependent pyruvate/acetoin dehydrogenase alpha subunit
MDDIDQRFRAAVKVSEEASPPSLESMFDDVYEELPWHLREQREQLVKGPRAPKSH